MILLIANEKGGTGKTTLAVNLAVRLLKDGKEILLVDADPQQSATAWAELRGNSGTRPMPVVVSKSGPGLDRDVRTLASRFGATVIDTGGRDSLEMRKGMLIADIVLVPVLASQFDVWVLEKMAGLIGDARAFNEGLKALLLVNRAPANPHVTEERDLREFLSEIGGLRPLSGALRERIAWRKAAREGRAVFELEPPDPKACREFETVYDEIIRYSSI